MFSFNQPDLYLPRQSRWLRIGALLTALLGAASAGCSAKMTVTASKGPSPLLSGGIKASARSGAVALPVLVPGGLTGPRTYFQSRSVISFDVTSSVVPPGEQFSLYNDSTKATLIDQQALSPGPSGSASLVEQAGHQITIEFYLMNQSEVERWTYGTNDLRLMVTGQDPKEAQNSIHLEDFPVQTVQASHFTLDVQTVDGFQGEVTTVTNQVVSNGQGFLTTGFLALVNQ